MKGQVSLTTVALAAAVIAATAAGVYVYSSQSSGSGGEEPPAADNITNAHQAGTAAIVAAPPSLCDGAWTSDDLDPLQVIIDSVASTGLPPEDSDYDCADINGDGSLTSDDSTCLAGILAGMYTSLGECPRCTADSAMEICHDGADNNCDGQTDKDTYDEEAGAPYASDLCSCTPDTPCQMSYDANGIPGFAPESDKLYCREMGDGRGYRWLSEEESLQMCNESADVGRRAHCNGIEPLCTADLKWDGCRASTDCLTSHTIKGVTYWCRNFGNGWSWQNCANCGKSDMCQKKLNQISYTPVASGAVGICSDTLSECKGNSWNSHTCEEKAHCNVFESGNSSYWCVYDDDSGWIWEKCTDCDEGVCRGRSDYDPYLIGVDYMPNFYGGEQADPQRKKMCDGSTLENPLKFNGSEWDYLGYFFGCCNGTADSVCGKCPGPARYGPEFDKTCNWKCVPCSEYPGGCGKNYAYTSGIVTYGCEDYYSRWEGFERMATLLENKDDLSDFWNDPAAAGKYNANQAVENKFANADVLPKRPLGPDDGYLGFYDSLDPAVMRTQIDLAQQYGVDFFAFVWVPGWYNEWNGSLPLQKSAGAVYSFMQAVRPGRDELKFVVNWIGSGVEYANFQNTGETGIYAAVAKAWLENGYLTHPNYLKINGKPVVYIMYWKEAVDHLAEKGELGSYSLAVQMYNKGLQRMRDVINGSLGVEPYIVGAGSVFALDAKSSELQGLDLDAFTFYIGNIWTEDKGYYSNVITNTKKHWGDFYTELKKASPSKPFYPTMSNDIFVSVPTGGTAPLDNGMPMVKGSTQSTFYTMAENARDFVDKNADWYPRIIMDYAWSEWGENNVLEPTVASGYDYLEVVENVFGEGLEHEMGIKGICTEGNGEGCDGMTVSSPFTVVVEGLDTGLLDNDTIAEFIYCPSGDGDPKDPLGSCSAGWSTDKRLDTPDGGYASDFDLEPGTYDIVVNLRDNGVKNANPSGFMSDPLFYLELWNENDYYWIDNLVVA